jgi:hypothetical protein
MTGGTRIAAGSDAGDIGPSWTGWSDGAWAGTVGWCDAMLRRLYRIREFTDDPDCVIRVGLRPARGSLVLSDGTRIEAGETIGTLHFWNEHLPRYAARSPGLGWACEMRRLVVHSLGALACYIEIDPAWRDIKALHAESALSSRLGVSEMIRLAHLYGFEAPGTPRSFLQRLHDFGDDFLLWGLARTFNPAVLPHLRFFRPHRDLWISRFSLLQMYLPRCRINGSAPTSHGTA